MKTLKLQIPVHAVLASFEAKAPLDTKHWVPPYFAKPGPGTFGFTYEVENEVCGLRAVTFELEIAPLPDAGMAMEVTDECIGAEVDTADFLVGGALDAVWVDQLGKGLTSTLITLQNAGVFGYHCVVSSEPCRADSDPDDVFKVFNRWGSEVFTARPCDIEWSGMVQSGIIADSKLPVETYFYILDLRNAPSCAKAAYTSKDNEQP